MMVDREPINNRTNIFRHADTDGEDLTATVTHCYSEKGITYPTSEVVTQARWSIHAF